MKIICSGGGTGGHIYPALALMRYIQAQDETVEFLYIGTEKGLESKIVPAAGYAFQAIKMQGLKRSLSLDNLKTLYYTASSIQRAKKIIREFQPDVVIGTGGYVCAPVLYAAARMKIPTIIHEQNSVAGVTNKLLAPFVSKIAICFEEVAKDFAKQSAKVVMTGNPRGQEVVQVQKDDLVVQKLRLNPSMPTVVIFGGSRGAPSINQAFIEAYDFFKNKEYQVVAITGDAHYEEIKTRLEQKEVLENVHLFPYMNDLPQLFLHAHLVICRSGATTLTELTALGLPSILVPSPYVTNNHQEHNAMALVHHQAAMMILQGELTGERLAEQIDQIMGDVGLQLSMSRAAKELGIRDANDRLWQMIQTI